MLDSSYANPESRIAPVQIDAARAVRVEVDAQVVDADAYGRFVRVHLRHRAPGPSIDEELDAAVAAATAADVAVVIVGTNPETESEGWDRPDLALPGRQNELVRRVAAANPRTVVVVNAGAPVLLPWLDEIAAVLWWWLPGQEAGASLAAVLTGAVEPSGRLPWTLPADEADVPVPHGRPQDGCIDYTEGVHVGHRGWDRLERTPAREFGYGLGYGSWRYERLELTTGEAGGLHSSRASRSLNDVGERDAREVVQVYLEAPDGDPERPVRWLAGFAVVDVAAGARETADVPIARRSFETWSTDQDAWILPTGSYRVRTGRIQQRPPPRGTPHGRGLSSKVPPKSDTRDARRHFMNKRRILSIAAGIAAVALVATGCCAGGSGGGRRRPRADRRHAERPPAAQSEPARHRLGIPVARLRVRRLRVAHAGQRRRADRPAHPVARRVGGVERGLHRGGHHRPRRREVVGRRGLHGGGHRVLHPAPQGQPGAERGLPRPVRRHLGRRQPGHRRLHFGPVREPGEALPAADRARAPLGRPGPREVDGRRDDRHRSVHAQVVHAAVGHAGSERELLGHEAAGRAAALRRLQRQQRPHHRPHHR